MIFAACDMATDAGCRHPFVAAVVDAIDQHLRRIAAARDELAGVLGWPPLGRCQATICSSRWNQETAGSDASGKERQRSRTQKDDAGKSRQTIRRRK